jgi:hypothetical protein
LGPGVRNSLGRAVCHLYAVHAQISIIVERKPIELEDFTKADWVRIQHLGGGVGVDYDRVRVGQQRRLSRLHATFAIPETIGRGEGCTQRLKKSFK